MRIYQLSIFFLLATPHILSEENNEESCEFLEPDYSLPQYAETEEERTQRLEKELFLALNQFDECLESSSDSSTTFSSESSEASNNKEEEKEVVNSNQAESRSDSAKDSKEKEMQESLDNGSPENNDNIFKNDDIVAKQLRQLAEEENDPDLKKKYWDKYYEYKGIKKKE